MSSSLTAHAATPVMHQAPAGGDTTHGCRRPPLFGDHIEGKGGSDDLGSLALVSRLLTFEPGPFDANHLTGYPQDTFGILIIDGLILAQLEVGRAHAGWLLGAEDLLRPWEMPQISLVRGVRWRALRRSRVLRVDGGFRHRLQHDPGFIQELLGRVARTSHWLFAKALVLSAPAIEDRLLLLFALWAERWGRVTPEGVWIDLPLTHQQIAELCGARRPTVSVSLRALERQGVIARPSRSAWLLRRVPELSGYGECWRRYATSLGPALGDGGGFQDLP